MWTIYRHYKGRHYLGIGPALHSESLAAHEIYRCLYDNERGSTWVRPFEMFHGENDEGAQRFAPIARVRIVDREDRSTVLRFGFDTWGGGLSEEAFIAKYDERDEFRGARYLIELLDGTRVAKLNTLRFARGVVGIASVATHPEHRRHGHATLLLRSVMSLFRLEDPSMRFLLFSEVDPKIYEACGFRALAAEHQFFEGTAIAMATGESPLEPAHIEHVRTYF